MEVGQFGTKIKKSGQFGIKQVNKQFGTKIRKWTIWHWNAYLAPDNLAHSETNISGTKQKTHQIDYLTTLFPFCSLKRALIYQIITLIFNV